MMSDNFTQSLVAASNRATATSYITPDGSVQEGRNGKETLAKLASKINTAVSLDSNKLENEQKQAVANWIENKKRRIEEKYSISTSSGWTNFVHKLIRFFSVTSVLKKLDESITTLRNNLISVVKTNETPVLFVGMVETPPLPPEPKQKPVQQEKKEISSLAKEIQETSSSGLVSVEAFLQAPRIDSFFQKAGYEEISLSDLDHDQKIYFKTCLEELVNAQQNEELFGSFSAISVSNNQPNLGLLSGLVEIESSELRLQNRQSGYFNATVLAYLCQKCGADWDEIKEKYHLGFDKSWLKHKELLTSNTIFKGVLSYTKRFGMDQKRGNGEGCNLIPASLFKTICMDLYQKRNKRIAAQAIESQPTEKTPGQIRREMMLHDWQHFGYSAQDEEGSPLFELKQAFMEERFGRYLLNDAKSFNFCVLSYLYENFSEEWNKIGLLHDIASSFYGKPFDDVKNLIPDEVITGQLFANICEEAKQIQQRRIKRSQKAAPTPPVRKHFTFPWL